MPNAKTDRKGAVTRTADQQRDLAAKGGPATGIGRTTGRRSLASGAIDSQTGMAARSSGKKTKAKRPVKKEK